MYLDKQGKVIPNKSLNGISSVATPGLIAGILEIHRKFGKLPLSQVMAPAIELAEQGFPVYRHLANAMRSRQELLAKYPASKAIFLKKNGAPYEIGEILVQKDLGKTLREIAKEGEKSFYHGKIEQKILQESKRLHGILSDNDFAEYKVKWREPLQGTFQGYTIFGMPPPSSGGIHVQEILNILEKDPLKEYGFFSAQSIHLTAAAMQLAFADRSKILDSKAKHAEDIAPSVMQQEESLDTTHFSMIDAEGNMVSATETIDYLFGSGVVVPGTGIVLNDEMDDFSVKQGSANVFGALGEKANAIAPGKTPLSSMSPTLILKDNKPIMAVGAPGGTRIISCVLETVLNYLQYKMPIYESVAAPRIHHQWQPDVLAIDSPGPGLSVLNTLRTMGYQVDVEEDAVPCRVEAVANEDGKLVGAADPRDLGISLAE
jgi:gamma-glutamyltranspeptidase/glutathione hydrolase